MDTYISHARKVQIVAEGTTDEDIRVVLRVVLAGGKEFSKSDLFKEVKKARAGINIPQKQFNSCVNDLLRGKVLQLQGGKYRKLDER